jgi:hypothetical protein
VSDMSARAWRVMFEAGGVRRNLLVTNGPGMLKEKQAVLDAVAEGLRAAIRSGGCRGFFVSVHPDGADCDHEVR